MRQGLYQAVLAEEMSTIIQMMPGSPEAVEKGCACPTVDNGNGAGRDGDGANRGWVVNGSCHIHGANY